MIKKNRCCILFLAILIWSAFGVDIKILAELLCPLKAHAAFTMGSACVFMLTDINVALTGSERKAYTILDIHVTVKDRFIVVMCFFKRLC